MSPNIIFLSLGFLGGSLPRISIGTIVLALSIKPPSALTKLWKSVVLFFSFFAFVAVYAQDEELSKMDEQYKREFKQHKLEELSRYSQDHMETRDNAILVQQNEGGVIVYNNSPLYNSANTVEVNKTGLVVALKNLFVQSLVKHPIMTIVFIVGLLFMTIAHWGFRIIIFSLNATKSWFRKVFDWFPKSEKKFWQDCIQELRKIIDYILRNSKDGIL